MTIRGPDSPGSTPRSGRAYPGGRGPAWSVRAFEAIILAIVAITLVIWFALGKFGEKGAGQQPCTAMISRDGTAGCFLKSSPALPDWSLPVPGLRTSMRLTCFPELRPQV
jgi:hypothetical protein